MISENDQADSDDEITRRRGIRGVRRGKERVRKLDLVEPSGTIYRLGNSHDSVADVIATYTVDASAAQAKGTGRATPATSTPGACNSDR